MKIIQKSCTYALAAVMVALTVPVHAQYYNLSVGTERYFDNKGYGNDIFSCCFLIDTHVSAFERVIDEVMINDTLWAVVEYEHYLLAYSPSAGGDVVYGSRDTTLYRMDGPNLIERSDGNDRIIFNFEWEVGDDVYDKLKDFLSQPARFQVEHTEEGPSTIQIDTTIRFPNGRDYRIIWGDVTETMFYDDFSLPSPEDFLSNILIERYGMLFPFQRSETNAYAPVLPYYQIGGLGALFTFFNHRGLYMVGFKSSDGTEMGYTVTVPTSIEERDSHPASVRLHQNYPNPFNPTTEIRWTEPGDHAGSPLRLTVHDLLGREIAVLADGHYPSGEHRVTFDASRLASGMYLYRLETPSGVVTRKMTLVK